MSVQQRNIVDNFRLIGVFSSAANYLAALVNESTAAEGMCYYDTTLNQLRTHDGTNWSAAGQNGMTAGSINDAFTIGQKITMASTTGLELEATDAALGTDVPVLLIDNNDVGSDIHCLECDQIASCTAAAIQITNATTSTKDINGSGDAWYVLGTGYSVFAGLSLGDAANLYFGGTAGTGDVTFDFNDGVAVGTASGGLIVNAVATDECIQFGSGSSYNFDVWFSGNTSTGNMMYWDMDGGINSVGALQFDNADLLLGDNDAIVLGDGYDAIIQSDADNIQITTSTNNTAINIGDGTKDFDVKWFAGSTGDYVLFDQSEADIDIIDVDVGFDDDSLLQFGSSDDVVMAFGGSTFTMTCLVADQPWTIGATNYGFDITYYFESSGDMIIDYDAKTLAFDGADIRMEDDDYLLLGNSAIGGNTDDGTIRWDSSGSTIEIIGDTLFESDVTVDGDLTISGALNVTGTWDPASFTLTDNEYIYFGTGPDYKVLHIASTINILQISANADNDVIRFGDGVVDGDIIYAENADTSGANFWWDGSGEELFFGKSGDGMDCTWYSETANSYMKWDQDGSTNIGQLLFEDSTIIMMDDTKLLFGDGASNAGDWHIMSSGTNLIIAEVSAAGKMVQFGAVNEGCLVRFYGDTDGYNCTWNCTNDALFFADNAEIGVGGSAGTHDLTIRSDGTTAFIEMGTNLCISGEDKNLIFGASHTNSSDLTLQAASSAGVDIKWDAGAETLSFDGTILAFDGGTASAPKYTITQATGSTYLHISADDSSTCAIQFGDASATTNGLDVNFMDGSGAAALAWNPAATTFTIADPTQLVFSGSGMGYTMNLWTDSATLRIEPQFDSSTAKISFGTSTASLSEGLIVELCNKSGQQGVAWDPGATTFTIVDPSQLVFSGSGMGYTLGLWTDSATLRVEPQFDSSLAKIAFGTSTASLTNGLDIEITNKSGQSAIKWDCGATTFTIADPTQLIFSGSTCSYTVNQWTDSSTLRIECTDDSLAKIAFGTSAASSHGMDVEFCDASGIGSVKWDAAATTFTIADPAQLVFSGSDCNYTINQWTDSSTLRIECSDESLAKIAFGTSAASSHGLDIAFCDGSGIEAINWDAASTTFTFNDPTSLVFGSSDVDYTMNIGVSPSSTTALVINATDTSYAKVEFGLTNGESTNGLDVVFCSATGDSNLTWDAGAGTLSTASSGVSIVGVAASGVWEHALILPTTNSAPTTSTATGSGAIVYSHDSSALYIFTGSSWLKTAAGALTS